MGRRGARSTSSSTCSSGRATIRSSSSRSPGPSCDERHPASASRLRNATSLYLEPLADDGDGRAARRPRARAPRDAARADPRPRRGRPALRRRDGADAARPRPARARGRRATASTGDDRRRSRSGDPARADRRPARRPRRRRSGACSSDAAVLGKTFTPAGSPRLGGLPRTDARAAARIARAQGDARRSRPTRARPSAASTASSRTSFSASRTRRCPGTTARRCTSPPPTTSTRTRASTRTRSPR